MSSALSRARFDDDIDVEGWVVVMIREDATDKSDKLIINWAFVTGVLV